MTARIAPSVGANLLLQHSVERQPAPGCHDLRRQPRPPACTSTSCHLSYSSAAVVPDCEQHRWTSYRV
ncbi:hypothetical protein GUJ93_ZPchr0010g8348 [Zizania palustris]|uniref:Uncharacterized protein n=1 Tax=Zizania palustris TaxID=103762 RepID=A0A8J5WH08_ZIZPA|nr:hypothetical protein GUJ93_ZPchr0010g8348 [Zizania palustris]